MDDGSVVADIVDPHGHHLSDALPKLKGLAKYAEANGTLYRRIDAVTEVKGKFRVLDLKEKETIEAVLSASDLVSLYESSVAVDYLI